MKCRKGKKRRKGKKGRKEEKGKKKRKERKEEGKIGRERGRKAKTDFQGLVIKPTGRADDVRYIAYTVIA